MKRGTIIPNADDISRLGLAPDLIQPPITALAHKQGSLQGDQEDHEKEEEVSGQPAASLVKHLIGAASSGGPGPAKRPDGRKGASTQHTAA